MGRKTKAEAERTRMRVLKAALDLFVEKGYERTTFEDVAARIGLSKGAVYWHFKNKPDLLTALVNHMTDRHTVRVARALALPATLDTIEALPAHFVQRARLITASPFNRRYFLMMRRLDWPSSKFAPIRSRIRKISSAPHAIITHALEEMKRNGVLVSMILMVLWLGLVEHAIVHCLDADTETAIRLGFQGVLDTVTT